MKEFDQKIRELSHTMEVPKDYEQKIDDILQSLPETSVDTKKNNFVKRFIVAACILFVVAVTFFSKQEANANILARFKLTIMDIFHLDTDGDSEKMGVESNDTQYATSKSELFMELKESVVDAHTMYLLIKITASSEIAFTEDMGFDYYAFCEGENYNANQLISGAKDCYLLEVAEEKPNVATYVVTISTDNALQEDMPVTVYFKDLKRNPFSADAEMIVEGMWSLTFTATKTVRDQILIHGTPDMEFSYINTKATVELIEMTPLELNVRMDVSAFPSEELGINDTRVDMRLKMTDGRELMIAEREGESETIVDMGSYSFDQDGEKTYQTATYHFKEILDLNQVAGIYIEDIFIPIGSE